MIQDGRQNEHMLLVVQIILHDSFAHVHVVKNIIMGYMIIGLLGIAVSTR